MSRCTLMLGVSVLLGLLLVGVTAQSGTRGTQYAILISVSKYAKADQWRTLKYTIEEMDEFRSVLTKTGFATENIVFLHDRQTDEKLRPTGANIFKKLDLLMQEIGSDDTLLVAFNGHGVQFGGDLTGFFAPVNADLNDKKTLVAMDGKDGLYGRLEQCKARKKLLIVNACRNDPTVDFAFAAKKYDLVDKEDRDPPKGTAALFSCKPGQKSYEYPTDQNRKRSFFYHHLIEAWQGKYADGEKVTLDHVFDQVVRKTAADARNIFSESQTPWPRRKYEGVWLLSAKLTSPPIDKKEPTGPDGKKLKPGELITNSLDMKLAYIPPGKFLMGSPEAIRGTDEFQHEVTITKGFYLGVFEVTQTEYEQVTKTNPSWFRTDGGGKSAIIGVDTRRFPVENVSKEDAKEFCRKLSAKEKRTYRLPSEAEWEYACRAGSTTPFHFGAAMSTDQANYKSDALYRKRPMPVGSFPANAWGLHDMHGNIAEWCEDLYAFNYYSVSPASDPLNTTVANGEYSGLIRGGCWGYPITSCRTAIRIGTTLENRMNGIGFRVALSVP